MEQREKKPNVSVYLVLPILRGKGLTERETPGHGWGEGADGQAPCRRLSCWLPSDVLSRPPDGVRTDFLQGQSNAIPACSRWRSP